MSNVSGNVERGVSIIPQEMMEVSLGPLMRNTVTANAGVTLGAECIVHKNVFRAGTIGAGFNDQMPTAAAIIAALGSDKFPVGAFVTMLYTNTVATQTATLTTSTGVTMAGTVTIGTGLTRLVGITRTGDATVEVRGLGIMTA